MSDEQNLTIICWGQTLALFFAFFGFLSATDSGLTCCTSCVILYLILRAWKKQVEERLQLKRNYEGAYRDAMMYEDQLDYDHALSIYRRLNLTDDIRRVNEKKYGNNNQNMASTGVTNTTIIHGNVVNDNDTIVKDSVLNRSNIGGAGNSKADELQKLSDLKDKGLIDDEEFKEMKKEILGK